MPFCDVVGSTELSARLDLEDMSAWIRAWQNTVAGEDQTEAKTLLDALR